MPADVYLDPTRSPDERVNDLLDRMTLDEKLAQLGGVWITDLLQDGRFALDRAAPRLAHGIGHVTRLVAATGMHPADAAALGNEVQAHLKGATRLGIPAIVHEEACAGFMARDATCFPQAIGQAATWAPELVEAMGRVVREQMRAVGTHHALAPVLDVARDPRWGRMEETYGEDPYLIGRMGVAYVRGVQGEELGDGSVVATAKHFIGYGASEGGLNWAPARIMPRELREVYAAPFAAAIEEAGIASAMNAYHEFDGVVVSDYFTLQTLVAYHRVARDKSEAARYGLEAGIDIELPAHDCYGDPLRDGLASGAIDPQLVDASVRRVLEQKVRLGLFENPFVEAARAPLVFDTAEQRALAREMAVKSLVLLRNEAELLPLKDDVRVALIGPGADDRRLLQGDYHYPAHVEVQFESQGDLPAPTPMIAARVEDLADHYPPMVTLLDGLRARIAAGGEVLHARGCDVLSDDTSGFEEAVAAARAADVAIVVVGDRSGLTDAATCGEARDRADIGLPGVQEALVEAVVATGTPVVLLLLGGRPLALAGLHERVGAILAAWLPGEEGGTAVAAALFGDESPSGKLPVSFPRDAAQIPVYYGHKPSGGRSHWKGAYVDLPTTPLYPFGHGLTYTRFGYADLSVAPAEATADGDVTVSFELRNEGARAAEEVVQLYVRDPVASVTRPVQQLVGFTRVALEPGQARRVAFRVPVSMLAFYDRTMRHVVEPGAIEVQVGASSADVRLRSGFTIVGDTREVPRRSLKSHATVS